MENYKSLKSASKVSVKKDGSVLQTVQKKYDPNTGEESLKTKLTAAKQSLADMKSRGGPGGRSKLRKAQRDRIGKKEGGKIVKASKGSQGKLIGKQKKLDVNKDGKITGSDFEMLKGNRKKYGGKISYRMTGGQVVDSSYD